MLTARGYSLWLIPHEEAYIKLSHLISQLSEKYKAPCFAPHVTLIGGIASPKEEIISKTANLASMLNPFGIELNGLRYSDKYFKCLFLKAKETDEIKEASQKARGIFNMQDSPEYMPHLSLIYGNYSTETKERIISEIGEKFSMSFEIRNIHLFSTSGEPRFWHYVKEFPSKNNLNGPDRI